MTVSTLAGVDTFGLAEALTVLEIASTPVSDEPPLANARSTMRTSRP